jgi:hypothetical protein
MIRVYLSQVSLHFGLTNRSIMNYEAKSLGYVLIFLSPVMRTPSKDIMSWLYYIIMYLEVEGKSTKNLDNIIDSNLALSLTRTVTRFLSLIRVRSLKI